MAKQKITTGATATGFANTTPSTTTTGHAGSATGREKAKSDGTTAKKLT